jgi:hypothetical protein
MANEGKPLFHIDVHGKMDRADNFDLDLGVTCLYKHWINESYQEQDFIHALIRNLEIGFNHVLKNISHKGHTAKVNKDPYLNGNWGDVDIATMTE